MLKRGKRALSPVVSTVLLIMIVIILAVIVILWFKYFLKDAVIKFDKPVETTCSDVGFEVDIFESSVIVSNIGNVPIQSVVIYKISPGVKDREEKERRIPVGGSSVIEVDGLRDYEEIKVIPVLLGEVKGKDTTRAIECDESIGIDVVIE